MSRVTITLCSDEREALVELALSEVRTPRDQARYLVRRALIQLGWLKAVKGLPKQKGTEQEGERCSIQN